MSWTHIIQVFCSWIVAPKCQEWPLSLPRLQDDKCVLFGLQLQLCDSQYNETPWRAGLNVNHVFGVALQRTWSIFVFHRGVCSCLHCSQVTSCFTSLTSPLCICSHNISDCWLQRHVWADRLQKQTHLHFRRCRSSRRVSFSYRQHGDVRVHQVVRLHHVLRLRGRRLGGDHDHGADVLRQSWRTQEVRRVLQEAQF